jgi:hypothetical protein
VVPRRELRGVSGTPVRPRRAATALCQRRLARATADLERLERGLGSRHYPTPAKVAARIAVITKDRRVGAYLHTETGSGKPTLARRFDQDAINTEAATDGWYALLTKLPADQVNAAQVLILYKGQEAVERRYAAFKGPLAIATLYLKNNWRIATLTTVICLALLIFCLIERQVRQALAAQGHTKIQGLYADLRGGHGDGRRLPGEDRDDLRGHGRVRGPVAQPAQNDQP